MLEKLKETSPENNLFFRAFGLSIFYKALLDFIGSSKLHLRMR
jgi:hypothetical protein